MERYRPLYFSLTDGSGGKGVSRVHSTDRLLQRVGARAGAVHGRFTDKEFYRHVLDGDVEIFTSLASEIAASFIASEIGWVAGDAMEGFNPAHDICRAIIDSAATIVHETTGRVLANYEFAVHEQGTAAAESVVSLPVDPEALDRKLAAALENPDMRTEVLAALESHGSQAFATEYLRPTTLGEMLKRFEATSPQYEEIGTARVRDGRYSRVIRHSLNVLPIISALGVAAGRDLASLEVSAAARS